MFRASFTVIVVAILIGCTSEPTQTSIPTETASVGGSNELSTPLIEPSLEDWISLGHMLWAWVFAICGGFVTQAIWRRRSTAGER